MLKRKLKSNGTIDKFKVRLVATDFSQAKGINYQDTYSHVAKFISIRIILAIVAHFDLKLYQMDVKTAFLNGELNNSIYMK